MTLYSHYLRLPPLLQAAIKQACRLGLGAWWKIHGQRPRFILLLSHMRSGSTLLTHILNSSPEIAGYGETHRYYRSRQDLDDLIVHEAVFLGRFLLRERYVLDKILHDAHIEAEEIISADDVRVLFLVREPGSTLSSMLRHSSEPGPLSEMLPATESQALSYYASRLASLEKYARIVPPQQAFFLTYDDLLGDSEHALNAIASWLDLHHPLSEQYQVHKATGRWGTGDGGGKIRTGTIVKSPQRQAPDWLSPETLLVAGQAYENTCRQLSSLCRTIDNSAKFGRTAQ